MLKFTRKENKDTKYRGIERGKQMICNECGNKYDSEYLMFCPICGAKSLNVDLPPLSAFYGDDQGGKHLVPLGFMLEPTSGYYYYIKKKQISYCSFANEITWFDPSSGKSAKKEYLMSNIEVLSMTSQEKENIALAQSSIGYHENTYDKGSMKKKRSFLIALVVTFICISLGYYAIRFI